MQVYVRLHLFALAQTPVSWEVLCSMGPINIATTTISASQVYYLAELLLLFDFDVRDLI